MTTEAQVIVGDELPSMVVQAWKTIDRIERDWPSNPLWDDEPDKVQYQVGEYAALAVRNYMGAWCGYVGVPHGHPLYGLGYDDDALNDVSVHGGLTFAGPCQGEDSHSAGICHVPLPGQSDNVWWFGFDCSHLGDSSPEDMLMQEKYSVASMSGSWEQSYKTLEYVLGEIKNLVAAL